MTSGSATPVSAPAHSDLRWHDPASAEGRAANKETRTALEALIKAGRRKEVLKVLDGWPSAAVFSCFAHMRTKRAQKLLRWLSDETSLKVLAELDPRTHAALIETDSKAKFRKLLLRMDANKALRMLKELPEEFVDELLQGHPDETELRAALADEHTAAGEMRRGALAIPESWTIAEIIRDIRTRSDKIEKLDALHVVDRDGRLTGYLRIRDLLLHDHATVVGDVMRHDPLAVSGDTDQEEVLALARSRHDGIVAVVDHDRKLLGVITPRELAAIAREEAEEDMLLMGGVSPESTQFDAPSQIVRRRLPWLVIGLAGALITALVIGGFEDALTQAAILASFIPVVSATAGNASMQASTISIQAIGAGAGWDSTFLLRLGKEVLGASLNGLLMGAVLAGFVLVAASFLEIDRPLLLAATVSLAQICVIIVAGTLGTVIPFLLSALKIDPAVATGIFILTLNDVFGVLILFVFATVLYL